MVTRLKGTAGPANQIGLISLMRMHSDSGKRRCNQAFTKALTQGTLFGLTWMSPLSFNNQTSQCPSTTYTTPAMESLISIVTCTTCTALFNKRPLTKVCWLETISNKDLSFSQEPFTSDHKSTALIGQAITKRVSKNCKQQYRWFWQQGWLEYLLVALMCQVFTARTPITL